MFEPSLQLLDDIELDWSCEQDDEADGLHHCWRLTGNPDSSQTSLPSQHLHATFPTASQYSVPSDGTNKLQLSTSSQICPQRKRKSSESSLFDSDTQIKYINS